MLTQHTQKHHAKDRSSTRTAHAKPAASNAIATDGAVQNLPAGSPHQSEQIPWARIELGPELPIAVFTSAEVWHPERIGALAIYCSDGRWGEAFDEFCHKHLQIPRYDRMAIAGGPAWLATHGEK